jgi:hypothetical protein
MSAASEPTTDMPRHGAGSRDGARASQPSPPPTTRYAAILRALLLLATLLASGCKGCARGTYRAGPISLNPELWMADACRSSKDCKKTGPQGDRCTTFSPQMGGPNHDVCRPNSDIGPPCKTEPDCPPTVGPGAVCNTGWDCRYLEGGDVGTCLCWGTLPDCETDLDCKPSAFCPEGHVCVPHPRLAGNRCQCKRFFLDGGVW